jgi:hypothetical protein
VEIPQGSVVMYTSQLMQGEGVCVGGGGWGGGTVVNMNGGLRCMYRLLCFCSSQLYQHTRSMQTHFSSLKLQTAVHS